MSSHDGAYLAGPIANLKREADLLTTTNPRNAALQMEIAASVILSIASDLERVAAVLDGRKPDAAPGLAAIQPIGVTRLIELCRAESEQYYHTKAGQQRWREVIALLLMMPIHEAEEVPK